SVHLTRAGIVIDGAGKPVTITNAPKVRAETDLLECTGEIRDRCDSGGRAMSEMRETYDGHDHPGDSGGTTGKPNQGMG
ncbi:baseplate assembly protein, partial [Achromobacter pulmonis]